MNIDKFGHHVHKRLRVCEFFELENKTLLRSDNGDFDLQSSRLKGVADPSLPNDAVNKHYVDQLVQNTFEKKKLDSMFENINSQIEIINSQIQQLANQLKINFYTKWEINNFLSNSKDGKRTSRE